MKLDVLTWICGLLVVAAAFQEVEERKESGLSGRFIAKLTTRTRLLFTTSTTTVPFTCATFSSAVCRRRRRFQRLKIEDLDEKLDNGPAELFSGQLDDVRVHEGRRESRLSLTILRTVTTTTFTVTSTSTNSATTFSVSYFCSAPNVVFPPGC